MSQQKCHLTSHPKLETKSAECDERERLLHLNRMKEAFYEGLDLQRETLLRLQKYQYYATISASIVFYLDNSNPEIP